MIENLVLEGIKGELTSVSCIDINNDSVIVSEGMKVRNHKKF